MYLLQVEIFDGHPVGYEVYTEQELRKLSTRQLLAELHKTYGWDSGPYGSEGHTRVKEYVSLLKDILSEREHIPNKVESKQIRKLRKKQGK